MAWTTCEASLLPALQAEPAETYTPIQGTAETDSRFQLTDKITDVDQGNGTQPGNCDDAFGIYLPFFVRSLRNGSLSLGEFTVPLIEVFFAELARRRIEIHEKTEEYHKLKGK